MNNLYVVVYYVVVRSGVLAFKTKTKSVSDSKWYELASACLDSELVSSWL